MNSTGTLEFENKFHFLQSTSQNMKNMKYSKMHQGSRYWIFFLLHRLHNKEEYLDTFHLSNVKVSFEYFSATFLQQKNNELANKYQRKDVLFYTLDLYFIKTESKRFSGENEFSKYFLIHVKGRKEKKVLSHCFLAASFFVYTFCSHFFAANISDVNKIELSYIHK